MFRGWMSLGGAEIANTSRLLAHASPAALTDATVFSSNPCWNGCHLDVAYDDSWPGLQSYLGDSTYALTNAPWYDAAIPQSTEFLGIWVLKVDGDGPTPVDRSVNDAICAGGVAGPSRAKARVITVQALLIGCTNPGVMYGLEWLACRLRAATLLEGTTLDFLLAHPENSAASAASLRRTMNRVVLTQEPRINDTYNNFSAANRQGRMMTVSFELTVLDPYTYTPAVTQTVTWDTSVTESITWAHPPSCQDPSSCDEIPILASVTCVPNVVDTRPAQPPTCSGCTPVCSVQTRTKVLPEATGAFCVDEAYSFTITAGASAVSANFWLRPCGVTTLCERTAFLSLSGLPAGATVVADSVAGRAYGIIGGQQVRQLGIVYTPSGAPWTPAIVDASECWELVAQHEPGLSYTVQASVRGRAA